MKIFYPLLLLKILYLILPTITFLLLCTFSCNTDKTIILPDNITAGQKVGEGIIYVDFEIDINCFISDPWTKQDTTINLDLNKDGVDDFTFYRTMCHPGYLGGDCDKITLTPLFNNEICIIPTEYPDPAIEPCMHSKLDWVDTLSVSDTINRSNNWTNRESLIYTYSWQMNTCSIKEGFWINVIEKDDKYIGIKIVKDGKNYFGWIGLYNFIINDYAITQEYEK